MPGDCGAWVVNATTGLIYGHIVAGDPVTGIAYIIPAHKVFTDIERRLCTRPSLWSGEATIPRIAFEYIAPLGYKRPGSSLELCNHRDEAAHTEFLMSVLFGFVPHRRPAPRRILNLGDDGLMSFDAGIMDSPMIALELGIMDSLLPPLELVASEPKWAIDPSRYRRRKKSVQHGPGQSYDLDLGHTSANRLCYSILRKEPCPLSTFPRAGPLLKHISIMRSYVETLKGYLDRSEETLLRITRPHIDIRGPTANQTMCDLANRPQLRVKPPKPTSTDQMSLHLTEDLKTPRAQKNRDLEELEVQFSQWYFKDRSSIKEVKRRFDLLILALENYHAE